MADLPEDPTYPPGVYQLDVDDPVQGGPGGIANLAPQQLANRTATLRAALLGPDDLDDDFPALRGTYTSLRARLDALDPAGALPPELDPSMFREIATTPFSLSAPWVGTTAAFTVANNVLTSTSADFERRYLLNTAFNPRGGFWAASVTVTIDPATPLDFYFRGAGITACIGTTTIASSRSLLLGTLPSGTAQTQSRVIDGSTFVNQPVPYPIAGTPYRLMIVAVPPGVYTFLDGVQQAGIVASVNDAKALYLALYTDYAIASFSDLRLYEPLYPAL